jgi:uncharacterized membrane protein YcaP (DUF421 family)
MRAERLNGKEVVAHLRGEGIRDLREVELAVVEDDGKISVLRRKWAEPATNADVSEEMARGKLADLNGREEPRGAERTDDPQWLT